MATKEEIAEAVKEILRTTVRVDEERLAKLRPDTVLKDELNIDSLDMIEMVYEVEDKFDVQIPEDKIQEIKTFQEVVDGLHAALTSSP